jgi:hypothetical protein
MKPLNTLLISLAVVVPFALLVRAADKEPWQSLFHGEDFAKWKVVTLRDPAPAIVEEGAMVLRQRINPWSILLSQRERVWGNSQYMLQAFCSKLTTS